MLPGLRANDIPLVAAKVPLARGEGEGLMSPSEREFEGAMFFPEPDFDLADLAR
jgi:hypothetical protein